MYQKDVTVLGGGSFGTVLANIAAENGYQVNLWMRDAVLAQEVNSIHKNKRYVPDYPLHSGLVATTDLEQAVCESPVILVSIPSGGFRTVVRTMAPFLNEDQILVSTTKGFEADGFKLMSQILASDTNNKKIGVLSGPNLAKEIAKHVLTATVIASEHEAVRESIQKLLANEYFRVYSSNDMYGVELGGALKNIYAIISGLAAALEMGENTRSMLITRSLAEMSRFAVSMGSNPMTFIGLSGVGDLIVTCMSPLSRNFRVGYALGKGVSLEQVVSELGEVAEGVNTLKLVKQEADRKGIYMPLANVLYEVIFNKLDIATAIKKLMLSAQNSDVEFMFTRE